MKTTLLAKWTFSRILRLILGITLTGQGFSTGEWGWAIPGMFFAGLALLNLGGCENGACASNEMQKPLVENETKTNLP